MKNIFNANVYPNDQPLIYLVPIRVNVHRLPAVGTLVILTSPNEPSIYSNLLFHCVVCLPCSKFDW